MVENPDTSSRKEKKYAGIASVDFGKLRELILKDDVIVWERHLEIRQRFEHDNESIFIRLDVPSVDEARDRAYGTIKAILQEFEGLGEIHFSPSHGIGHASRDYLHALILSQADVDPRDAYIRIVAGTLHDILGCSVVERFHEGIRSIRHAEASALIFWELAHRVGMDEDEAVLIYYALAAHTNYLVAMKVIGPDGKEREMPPYIKNYPDGRPIYFIFATQEVDRLDISGPCCFLRHYLSVAEMIGKEYYNADTGGFSPVSFAQHMRPLLRSGDEIRLDPWGATMREFMYSIAKSQNNDSVYGRFDIRNKKMVQIRDLYREMLLRIVQAFDCPLRLDEKASADLFEKLDSLIVERIEPTKEVQETVLNLQSLLFSQLPRESRGAWFGAFEAVIREYDSWSWHMKKEMKDIPQNMFSLPVLGNVDKLIS